MFSNINTLKVGVCFLDDIDGEGTPIKVMQCNMVSVAEGSKVLAVAEVATMQAADAE